MAQKRQERTELLVPRSKAADLIRTQIRKGEELAQRGSLKQLEIDLTKWSDFNVKLLRSIVNTSELLDEYGPPNTVFSWIAVSGGLNTLNTKLSHFRSDIHDKISRPEFILDCLPLIPESSGLAQPTGELEAAKSAVVPFVSMSFDEADKDINDYVTGILAALQIDFETGERYSRESIPQKVQSRIRSSGLFIVILVKRAKIEDGGYTAPPWLYKELGLAQGAQKDVIAWVERGIEDPAGLNYEKEVIYFQRDSVKEMKKATIKFLEALKEHNLV